MLSNRLAFVILALACIAAAGAGGYFGARQTVVPAATQAAEPETPRAAVSAPTVGLAEKPEAVESDRTPTPPVPALPPAPKSTVKPIDRTAATTTRSAQRVASTAKPSSSAGTTKGESPAVDRQGPVVNSAPAPAVPTPSAPPIEPIAVPRPDDRVAQEPPRAPEPPQKSFEELVVVADSVIGLQSQSNITSDQARVEDRVEARVSRDVRVRDMLAIPAGSRALGTVVSVERGGKFKERARLAIRFNTLVLADGTRIPISTDTIYREGQAPGKESASKMTGAAVGGAILGAIIGGGKGAAIGAGVGAGAGAAATVAGDRSQAALYSGEPITVRLLAPVTVTIEQK